MDNSSTWRPSLTLMDQGRIQQLHDAATTILEGTGLNVHHPEMRRRLGDAGAKLGEGALVHIPAGMVERALETAKKDVAVYDRLGDAAGTPSDLLRHGIGPGLHP